MLRFRTLALSTLTPLAALWTAACADGPVSPDPRSASAPASLANSSPLAGAGTPSAGAVYTLTNAADENQVLAFRRAASGSLTPLGRFATGGRGTGGTVDPLQSQYAVVLTREHDALFAVDAGSDQVSGFQVLGDGSLVRTGTVASGGVLPVSLAVHDGLLYVLNAADNALQGFRIAGGARLVPIPGARTLLAPGADGAAAVRFTPDGRFLIVSERGSNRLEAFPVRSSGRLGPPVVTAASGGASFGFDITARNQVIVSETQGALTSYALGADGTLTTVTPSAGTGGEAACWVTITADGRFAYTTNAASGTVAGFAVDADGRLSAMTLAQSGDGATPIDLDHVGTRFVYALEAGTGTIGTFVIGDDGSLSARPDTPAGAPASGLQGLAAY